MGSRLSFLSCFFVGRLPSFLHFFIVLKHSCHQQILGNTLSGLFLRLLLLLLLHLLGLLALVWFACTILPCTTLLNSLSLEWDKTQTHHERERDQSYCLTMECQSRGEKPRTFSLGFADNEGGLSTTSPNLTFSFRMSFSVFSRFFLFLFAFFLFLRSSRCLKERHAQQRLAIGIDKR